MGRPMYSASGIKSIQRGTITITNATNASATVNAVDPSKSTLTLLGWGISTSSVPTGNLYPTITLVDATTVRASRTNNSSGQDTVVGWQLVEWE